MAPDVMVLVDQGGEFEHTIAQECEEFGIVEATRDGSKACSKDMAALWVKAGTKLCVHAGQVRNSDQVRCHPRADYVRTSTEMVCTLDEWERFTSTSRFRRRWSKLAGVASSDVGNSCVPRATSSRQIAGRAAQKITNGEKMLLPGTSLLILPASALRTTEVRHKEKTRTCSNPGCSWTKPIFR